MAWDDGWGEPPGLPFAFALLRGGEKCHLHSLWIITSVPISSSSSISFHTAISSLSLYLFPLSSISRHLHRSLSLSLSCLSSSSGWLATPRLPIQGAMIARRHPIVSGAMANACTKRRRDKYIHAQPQTWWSFAWTKSQNLDTSIFYTHIVVHRNSNLN